MSAADQARNSGIGATEAKHELRRRIDSAIELYCDVLDTTLEDAIQVSLEHLTRRTFDELRRTRRELKSLIRRQP